MALALDYRRRGETWTDCGLSQGQSSSAKQRGLRDSRVHTLPTTRLGSLSPQQLCNKGLMLGHGLWGWPPVSPQYSQRASPIGRSASARSSPEAPPRRYLPLRARMAKRPRSLNSKRKSSAKSPSLHTLPWLPVYQNPPPRPGGKAEG